MKVTVIGAGSAFNFAAGNTSLLFEHKDIKLLLDCGFNVPQKLQEMGLLDKITHVAVTHLHSDHIGGLELLAQWRYFVSQKSCKVPKLLVPQKVLPGLRRTLAAGLGHIQDDHGRPLSTTLDTYFDIELLRAYRSKEDFTYVGYPKHATMTRISAHPVLHVPGNFPSYAFEVGWLHKGVWRSIAYSGDTREVYKPTSTPTLLFHDCQLYTGPNDGAGDVHIDMAHLGEEMPEDLRKKTKLIHYGANVTVQQEDWADLYFNGFARAGEVYYNDEEE